MAEADMALTLTWGELRCTVTGFADPFNTMAGILAAMARVPRGDREAATLAEAVALGCGHRVTAEGRELRVRPGAGHHPTDEEGLRALIAAASGGAAEAVPTRIATPPGRAGGPEPQPAAEPGRESAAPSASGGAAGEGDAKGAALVRATAQAPSRIRPRRPETGPRRASRPVALARAPDRAILPRPDHPVQPRRVPGRAGGADDAALRALVERSGARGPAAILEMLVARAEITGDVQRPTRATALACAAGAGDRSARDEAARALAELVRTRRLVQLEDGRLALGPAAQTGREVQERG